jgi:peptide/nickel transport system substrate-binding protein
MSKLAPIPLLLCALLLASCRHASHSAQQDHTVVFLIESSPTSLDPRIGVDAQSEHIDELLFDSLVVRSANFQFSPGLASSWDQPDPLTVVFHLRPNVRFSDGRPLTSRDVAWTVNSLLRGVVLSPKSGSFTSVDHIDTPDPSTVIFHLKHPDNFLLVNLSNGAIGIVPDGSGRDFSQHPIGSGPFRFVSQEIDKEVVIDRNPYSWLPLPGPSAIRGVRFAVVPDATTRALELRKGSADLTSNSLPPDMLPVLAAENNLQVESIGGTMLQHLTFNTTDPILSHPEVRQAIACSIDLNLILKTLLGGHARAAVSLLPEQHWAWTGDVPRYAYDPARARRLLDQAGFHPDAHGIRIHLTMKTSTDEGARLLAATLQQQLAQAGISLDIRSYETATFLQDLVRGSFQMYSLRWIGGNEQPDIFGYAFSTARIPPKGANRSRYRNPELDRLLDEANRSIDPATRIADYHKVQQILARDLPSIDLWYQDSILVHNRRISNISLSPSGSFAFLATAKVQP